MNENLSEIEAIDVAITALQVKKQLLQQVDKMEPAQYLAHRLHQKLCHWNHTDGCGYFYEVKNNVHQWKEREHADWLAKAELMIRDCDESLDMTRETASKFLSKLFTRI